MRDVASGLRVSPSTAVEIRGRGVRGGNRRRDAIAAAARLVPGRIRPAPVGFEIAWGGTGGTHGPLLIDRHVDIHLLSNVHVLTDYMRRTAVGQPIVQPATGGAPKDQIAWLSRYTRLDRSAYNLCDAAIATVQDPSLVSSWLADGHSIYGVDTRTLGFDESVRLIGCRSGASWGRVRQTTVTRELYFSPDSRATI